ncbi:Uma2 family endonuclease [Corallococcus exiguus]|uniref:Uma2 family endonuclease n=1 Tax=Corallococcus exiguus TaxID=83462 RepID=A0A7Y1S7B5_9BACT|nr:MULTISPECIES: Uma2 family endonuclease [Corallococcus]RKI43102.1 Uma2 family endonuclease [Corallococcus sp. AB004]NBC42546.1 Uma2 family endonuclease [Corallococcus exiguus]NNC19508.1 Uma2 family endonuclease [Corallococcus exiguus]NPC74285.1 Uma2 family endonuclease [Corallococcus exiguus]NPD23769.1 Uma2 family endonuclease [Corallococcus exiguus]
MRHAAPRRTLAPHEEVQTLPHYLVGEALDGILYVSSPPITRKQGMTPLMGRAPEGWWWTSEPRLLLGEDVLVPDLAGWMSGRPPTLPDGSFIDRVPDWVCEVLSPATAKLDLTIKLPRYARAGIRHAWIINPVHRVVEVFRQDHERWVLLNTFVSEDRVRADPFGKADLVLAPFWTQV